MRICFVVNRVKTEEVGTTVYLLHEAWKRKHEVYLMGVGDFNFTPNETLCLDCTSLPERASPKTPEEHIQILKDEGVKKEIQAGDLDVLFIRNNPTEEGAVRQWAEHSGVAFGRMVQQRSVLVLNDAYALSHAFIDKLYFEELPAHIKPDSVITRKKEKILEFFANHNNKMILKPLEGSGGQGVYFIDEKEKNLNQIINNLSSEGYIIAQEYLPGAKEGDVRVLLLNGHILEKNGKYGLIKRVSGEGEFRSNIALGGTAEEIELTAGIRKIVEIIRPKIISDGLFFVGLDVVKDKLIEINVLSPGGIEGLYQIGLGNFADVVIASIEKKLEYKTNYESGISNGELATML